MNNFIYTVGISFLPLHDKAVETAKAVGPVEMKRGKKKSSMLHASENIQKEIDLYNLGKCPTCKTSFEGEYFTSLLDLLVEKKNSTEKIKIEIEI